MIISRQQHLHLPERVLVAADPEVHVEPGDDPGNVPPAAVQYSTVQYSTGNVPPAAVAEQRPDVVTAVGPAVVGMSWSHPARPGLV